MASRPTGRGTTGRDASERGSAERGRPRHRTADMDIDPPAIVHDADRPPVATGSATLEAQQEVDGSQLRPGALNRPLPPIPGRASNVERQRVVAGQFLPQNAFPGHITPLPYQGAYEERQDGTAPDTRIMPQPTPQYSTTSMPDQPSISGRERAASGHRSSTTTLGGTQGLAFRGRSSTSAHARPRSDLSRSRSIGPQDVSFDVGNLSSASQYPQPRGPAPRQQAAIGQIRPRSSSNVSEMPPGFVGFGLLRPPTYTERSLGRGVVAPSHSIASIAEVLNEDDSRTSQNAALQRTETFANPRPFEFDFAAARSVFEPSVGPSGMSNRPISQLRPTVLQTGTPAYAPCTRGGQNVQLQLGGQEDPFQSNESPFTFAPTIPQPQTTQTQILENDQARLGHRDLPTQSNEAPLTPPRPDLTPHAQIRHASRVRARAQDESPTRHKSSGNLTGDDMDSSAPRNIASGSTMRAATSNIAVPQHASATVLSSATDTEYQGVPFTQQTTSVVESTSRRESSTSQGQRASSKGWTCPRCSISYGTRNGLVFHMEGQHPEQTGKDFLHGDPAPFPCQYCLASYDSKHSLRDHMRLKHPDKRHEDGQRTTSQKSVEKKAFPCPHCTASFATRNYLVFHISSEHPERIADDVPGHKDAFPCRYCQVTYTTMGGLKEHVRTRHPNELHQETTESTQSRTDEKSVEKKAFPCPYCTASFATRNYLVFHISSEHPERMADDVPGYKDAFSCQYCQATYTTTGGLRDHMLVRHPNERQQKTTERTQSRTTEKSADKAFPCPHCSLSFGVRHNLLFHLEDQHPSQVINPEPFMPRDPLPCQHCLASYKSRTALKLHAETRHPDQVYQHPPMSKIQCDYCSKDFSHLLHLRNHMEREHPEVRVENPAVHHQCHYCQANYLDRQGFVYHMRTVHPSLPVIPGAHIEASSDGTLYKCEYKCGKTYPTRVELYYHQQADHRLEQRFCEYCGGDITAIGPEESHECAALDEIWSCRYTECRATFKTRTYLKNHETNGHVCGHCSETFPSPIKLRLHIRDITSNSNEEADMELVCEFCGSSLHSLEALNKHNFRSLCRDTRRHCSHCKKEFPRVDLLLTHVFMRGCRTHQCNDCQEIFSEANALAEHMDHDGCKNKFACRTCGQVFPDDLFRKYHETHDECDLDSMRNCDHCSEIFANSRKLKEHRDRKVCSEPELADADIAGHYQQTTSPAPRSRFLMTNATRLGLVIFARINRRSIESGAKEEREALSKDYEAVDEAEQQRLFPQFPTAEQYRNLETRQLVERWKDRGIRQPRRPNDRSILEGLLMIDDARRGIEPYQGLSDYSTYSKMTIAALKLEMKKKGLKVTAQMQWKQGMVQQLLNHDSRPDYKMDNETLSAVVQMLGEDLETLVSSHKAFKSAYRSLKPLSADSDLCTTHNRGLIGTARNLTGLQGVINQSQYPTFTSNQGYLCAPRAVAMSLHGVRSQLELRPGSQKYGRVLDADDLMRLLFTDHDPGRPIDLARHGTPTPEYHQWLQKRLYDLVPNSMAYLREWDELTLAINLNANQLNAMLEIAYTSGLVEQRWYLGVVLESHTSPHTLQQVEAHVMVFDEPSQLSDDQWPVLFVVNYPSDDSGNIAHFEGFARYGDERRADRWGLRIPDDAAFLTPHSLLPVGFKRREGEKARLLQTWQQSRNNAKFQLRKLREMCMPCRHADVPCSGGDAKSGRYCNRCRQEELDCIYSDSYQQRVESATSLEAHDEFGLLSLHDDEDFDPDEIMPGQTDAVFDSEPPPGKDHILVVAVTRKSSHPGEETMQQLIARLPAIIDHYDTFSTNMGAAWRPLNTAMRALGMVVVAQGVRPIPTVIRPQTASPFIINWVILLDEILRANNPNPPNEWHFVLSGIAGWGVGIGAWGSYQRGFFARVIAADHQNNTTFADSIYLVWFSEPRVVDGILPCSLTYPWQTLHYHAYRGKFFHKAKLRDLIDRNLEWEIYQQRVDTAVRNQAPLPQALQPAAQLDRALDALSAEEGWRSGFLGPHTNPSADDVVQRNFRRNGPFL